MSQVNKVRGLYLASSLYSGWTVEHKEWVTFRVKNFLQTFFRWKECSEEFWGCLPGAEGLSNRESFGMLGRYSLEHWRLRGECYSPVHWDLARRLLSHQPLYSADLPLQLSSHPIRFHHQAGHLFPLHHFQETAAFIKVWTTFPFLFTPL